MRLPIQYALTYPERLPTPVPTLSLTDVGNLEFEPPDTDRFPCLQLAYDALRAGGTFPTVLNAANEVAVAAFLEGRIGFMDIPRLVSDALERHSSVVHPDIEDILGVDTSTRKQLMNLI